MEKKKNTPVYQDIITFKNSQGDNARGTLIKVTRTTLVMEVYNPYSIVQLSEVLNDVEIRRQEQLIYQGRAVVSNLVNTGLMLIVSATLVDPWSELLSILNNKETIHDAAKVFVTEWEAANQLQPGYRLAVSELRCFFAECSRWLEQIDGLTNVGSVIEQPTLPGEFFDELANPLISQGDILFHKFEASAKDIPDEDIVIHKAFAQRDLHPLMMRSPFFHRSFTKPLGYAGDYEMVNMMIRDRREGPTSYSQIINSYFHQIGPTKAHRNRIDILIQRLTETANMAGSKKSTASILNTGCGPAIEVQRFIAEVPTAVNCKFCMLDFNRETLEYARAEIEKIANEHNRRPEINYELRSVHNLLKEARYKKNNDRSSSYDFIYCAGLFDYLSDRVCQLLLRLFYKWAKPGGKILATNVHPDNPSRWAMEHIVEWYMIYRDESHMLDLARGLGDQDIYVDDTGLNVFLEIQKSE